MLSDTLVPLQYEDGEFISFNKDGYDLRDRMSSFYVLYHKILTEVIWFLNPSLVVSVKSHQGTSTSEDVIVTQGHLLLQDVLASRETLPDHVDLTLRSINDFYSEPSRRIKTLSVSVDSNFLLFDEKERQGKVAS